MKSWMQRMVIACLACCLAAGSAMAAELDSFRVIDFTNECQYLAGGIFRPVEKGLTLPFGSTLRTGRGSSADLAFSDGNTFRLLARTTLEITQDARNSKLKVLRLASGSVELSLDDFPKDHKLQVETPTAVCGAVGTRFNVSFEYDPNDDAAKLSSRENAFSCSQGEVQIASRFSFNGEGQTMKAGSVKAGSDLVAVLHEGLENSYSDITVNRGRVTFEYGGGKESGRFSVSPEEGGGAARFVCAIEKSQGAVNATAVEVKSGVLVSEKPKRFLVSAQMTEVTPADGAVLVHEQAVLKQEGGNLVGDYLSAAKQEGELHSQWVDAKARNDANAALLEKEVYSAAAKATSLRQQLLNQRVIRSMKQIQRAATRGQINNVPKNRPRH